MATVNNTIERITKYSTEAWDTVYKQEAVTSVFDSNPALVKFTGAKTVKVAKFQSGGLGNYYRNNSVDGSAPSGANFVGAAGFGYQSKAAGLVWEEFTLSQDRAAAYQIEYFDNEESGDKIVGLGVTEINRTVMVPEVDAYCLSTIAGYAYANAIESGYSDKPLAALNKALKYMEEHEVLADDQIIFASPAFMSALRNTNEVNKVLLQEDYKDKKDVRFKIEQYEGRDVITVAPNRLRTNISITEDGYTWGTGSKAINFMVVSNSAVMHVVKYNAVKVIGGDTNLAARGFDGYTIFARIYHDVFVADNKRVAIYVNVDADEAAVPAPVELDINVGAGNKIKSISTFPGEVLCLVGKGAPTTDDTKDVGNTLTAFTAAKVGDMATTGRYFAIDTNKKVLGYVDVTVD